ncbi:hypothetical protein BH24ACT26_BH24ACT26_21240 [soil metagenome]
MTGARIGGRATAAVVGALVGALVVLGVDGVDGVDGLARTPRPATGPQTSGFPQTRVEAPSQYKVADSRVLLAWSPGGLPSGTEKTLENMAGVRSATTVIAGLDWISAARARDGTPLDAPPRGFAIPWEVALIQPREYAAFVPAAERDVVLGLRRGEALLAETETALRGAGEGIEVDLGDRTLRASAVVSDIATNGYEALISGRAPRSWTRADRFVLVRLQRASRRFAVRRRILELLPPGKVLRIRAQGETPFLRYGDAVQSQMLIKSSFGEFAARPLPDGRIEIEPQWLHRNIRRARVPVLGTITCHRAIFPQLREALREIVSDGVAYVIDRDPGEFGGCFNPRFIDRQPGGRLSHHAWGIALDINVSENAFGTPPDQDKRLVDRMEAWGFTWGGRWLIPDGMHFEWNRWP